MTVDEDTLHIFRADLPAAFKRPGIVAYHTPNGGKRPISTAKKRQNLVREPVSIAVRVISERFNLSLELAATISKLANLRGESR
jgi:hypothetical protein